MKSLPGWVEWWFTRLLGPERAGDVLGDLEELSSDRKGLTRQLWFLRQAAAHTVRRLTGREYVPPGSRPRSVATAGADVRLAFRTIRRSPGISAAIVATLALAVGATTALFSVADAVLFKALPFEQPDDLVVMFETEPPDYRRAPTSPPNLVDFRDAGTSFEAMGGWSAERFTLTGEGRPLQVLGIRVTGGFFETLRSTPAMGRLFDPADDADLKTVVLSHGFWSTRLGSDPEVLGRMVVLDDEPMQVVGVMPESFRFPDDDQVAFWLPLTPYPWELRRWTRTTSVLARLAPGASVQSATSELEAVAAGLSKEHPETNGGWGVELASARSLLGDQRTLAILFGTVGLVLLIACANVANLLLVRTTEREQELGIRAALGASRSRLVRLLFTESATYAVIGAALGVGVAVVGVRVLMSIEPGSLPRWNPVQIDGRALLFTGSIAVFVALAAGVVPALRGGGSGPSGLRGRPSRGRISDRSGARGRALLSSLAVALAVVLTSGAALLVTSLVKLRAQDPGFEANNLLTATLELPDSRYGYEDGRIENTYTEILAKARALPGVSQAGWVTALPMSQVGTDYDIEFFSVERPERTPEDTPARADFRVASDGYLETLGVPLVAGRLLDFADGQEGANTVVVNETLARRYFPEENPIGQHLRLYSPEGDAYRIVGIVGDVRHRGLDDLTRPEIYLHFRLMAHNGMTLALRTDGDPAQWAAPLGRIVAEVDPQLPLLEVRSMTSLVGATLAGRRFNTAVLLGFALLGLAIALVGVHGTIAFAVSRRTREIGLRMALGAGRRSVLTQVLARAGRLIAGGLLVGTFGSILLGRALESLLYGVSPAEPAVLLAMAAVVAMVALIACLRPAIRASRVDPMDALREG